MKYLMHRQAKIHISILINNRNCKICQQLRYKLQEDVKKIQIVRFIDVVLIVLLIISVQIIYLLAQIISELWDHRVAAAMENIESELSEALVPAKDALSTMEQAYSRYCQILQRYYAFALTKAEFVFVSIFVLSITHSMHIHYSNFFIVTEMFWIPIAIIIRCYWVPYASKMMPILLSTFSIAIAAFVFFSWLFLNHQPAEEQSLITFVLWLISLIMYLPLLVYILWLIKIGIEINRLQNLVKNVVKGKLKSIKVGRMIISDKNSRKQIKFGSQKAFAQSQAKVEPK